jgi:crotonobetaine/carnitine-CoA ligase
VTRSQGFVEILLRQRASQDPNATWLCYEDATYSWKDTLDNCLRFANALVNLEVKPKDHVAIMLSNRPEFLWAHFGCTFIGATSVPINIAQRSVTLHHYLNDSGAVVIVTEPDFLDYILELKPKLPNLRHVIVVNLSDDSSKFEGRHSFEKLIGAASTNDPEVEISQPGSVSGLLYTSGTTGPPKGVVNEANDTQSGAAALLAAMDVKPGETIYTALPLFHGNALLISAFGSIVLNARLALAKKFSASRFFDDLRKYDAVEFNALGGMISILLKQPPRANDREHSVRTVLSAGCPSDRWEAFESRFGVKLVEFYGMVDAPGLLLNDKAKVGSMGKPLGSYEFTVVDDDDNTLGPNKVGELVFKSPNGPQTSYHNLPDETQWANRNGWFHTGDLAEVDSEGYFYYRGRKKESIRRLGENISAWEIETVLNQNDSILESAAFGVPSELGEDEVMVAIVLQPNATLDYAEIHDYCAGKMAKHAVPRYIEIVDELPKTGTHRIQYQILKNRGLTDKTFDSTIKSLIGTQVKDQVKTKKN